MKLIERIALVIYSYIIIILEVVISLLIFNWLDIESLSNMVEQLVTGNISSKVILVLNIIFILLSIKCIFFDETSKEKIKHSQGILLKNENGELMISKESIDNMVKNSISTFENVKECNTQIEVNSENQIVITLFLTVTDNVVIKDLATGIQNKVKEEIKKISDLDVKEVNVKIVKLQETNQSEE